MPAKRLDAGKVSKTTELVSKLFRNKIIGQEEAAIAFTNVLERYNSGFYDRRKPIASLLFLGPTGTGKTASVETFVNALFDSPASMIKIDCAEFQHSHEIAKLVGSPPGYLGHRETSPALSSARVKSLQTAKFPFTVILFDEIEKSSDALWNLLLGILDKGTLTLGTNEVVDFTSTVIVMTSNVGSKEMALKVGEGALGFHGPKVAEVALAELKGVSQEAAKKKFLPEFLNRLDEIVVFNTLTEENLARILDIELNEIQDMIKNKGRAIVRLMVTPAARTKILSEGVDKKYNARFLKRAIEKRVSTPVSRIISSGQVNDQDMIVVDYVNEEFVYDGYEAPAIYTENLI